MKIFLSIFVCYWAFGMLLLPMGDFSALKDLREQYKHCKQTEDKDMTLVDFITDHLINIDGVFDNHDNGDKQKSHSPIHYAHHNITIAIVISYKINIVEAPVFFRLKTIFNYEKNKNYSYNYSTLIFHPPLA
jgi:hypothetical protein